MRARQTLAVRDYQNRRSEKIKIFIQNMYFDSPHHRVLALDITRAFIALLAHTLYSAPTSASLESQCINIKIQTNTISKKAK